jgi:hypothetical protein
MLAMTLHFRGFVWRHKHIPRNHYCRAIIYLCSSQDVSLVKHILQHMAQDLEEPEQVVEALVSRCSSLGV